MYALKNGASFCSLGALVVKMEQAKDLFVVNGEGISPSEHEENVHASKSASSLSPIFSLSCYAQTT